MKEREVYDFKKKQIIMKINGNSETLSINMKAKELI